MKRQTYIWQVYNVYENERVKVARVRLPESPSESKVLAVLRREKLVQRKAPASEYLIDTSDELEMNVFWRNHHMLALSREEERFCYEEHHTTKGRYDARVRDEDGNIVFRLNYAQLASLKMRDEFDISGLYRHLTENGIITENSVLYQRIPRIKETASAATEMPKLLTEASGV